jgi:DNA invertase Pin-like site-specific DNA recombinase
MRGIPDSRLPGRSLKRRGLDDLLAVAAAGDTVVTTRLDRLGRSLPHLLDLVEELTTRGTGLPLTGPRSRCSSPPATKPCTDMTPAADQFSVGWFLGAAATLP